MRLPLFSSHRSFLSSISHLKYFSLDHILPSTNKTAATAFSRLVWPRMNYTIHNVNPACYYHRHRRQKDQKVLVILGATGTGKSRLSVDLATKFFPSSEIINSDKMQMYRGLDITTNKISMDERRGVPHHLLGQFDPVEGEVNPGHFRFVGSSVIAQIASRSKLPMIVGGSNSFIHSLLVESFHPDSDPFHESSPSCSISSELRYKCCFLWVDVSFPVLSDYLSKRVDDMLDLGMVEELADFYDPEADDLERESENRVGLRKAIGVPEFDRYFSKYPPHKGVNEVTKGRAEEAGNDLRRSAHHEAVTSIKNNTCRLARRQIRKIHRLRMGGWDLHRVDASEAFQAAMVTSRSGSSSGSGRRANEIWERDVLEPSVKIVKRFLKE